VVVAIKPRLFEDRADAGRQLAAALERFREDRPVVVALPRGGVPVAREVADAIDAPLDVVLVRKIGAPFHPEYGVGAVGEDGVLLLRDEALRALHLSEGDLAETIEREREELDRRAELYRGDREPVSVSGQTVLLVDDGIATGGTALVGAQVLRRHGAKRIVLAVPVAPPDAEDRFAGAIDEFVCLQQPDTFFAVGQFYDRFGQVSDREVERLLAPERALDPDPDPPLPTDGGLDWSRIEERHVTLPADGAQLEGDLRLPPGATGIVLFAHGSGSSRLSPRNRQVAAALNGAGLATLLFDLLTERESADRRNVFDIPLLGARLVAATRWVERQPDLAGMSIGYFGASTGAGAALIAAAEVGSGVRAVVSRGGRPDLAGERLRDVAAPTLLIVGGYDDVVLDLNRDAAAALRCPHEISVVPGATHLFEEPGTLEAVCRLAGDWFSKHLAPVA